jgi:hypothetical protein
MDKNSKDRSLFYSEISEKFGINSLTRSKVTAFLIFTNLHIILWELVILYIIIDEKHVKTMVP